jgi:hypothetical protein
MKYSVKIFVLLTSEQIIKSLRVRVTSAYVGHVPNNDAKFEQSSTVYQPLRGVHNSESWL